MSAQDLEQRARELLAAESRGRREADTMLGPDVASEAAIRAIVAVLRQQPAPVDLEQFREAVKQAYGYYPVVVDGELHNQRDADRFAGFRLLSIIDSAGKVECAKPATVDGESTGALTMGQRAVAFELLRCCESWEPNVCVLGNVRAKDAADLMRSILAHQPAPVVDDARMARALEWARDVAQGMPASAAKAHLPAIEEAIAAYDPNCGARTVRVDDAVLRALLRFAETTEDEGTTDLPRAVLDGLVAFGYLTRRLAGRHGYFYTMTPDGDAALARAQGVQS